MRTLRPNLGAFDAVRGSLSIAQFADKLGLNRATVYRVLNGESAPSARFVAESVAVLPRSFDDLFDVVDQEAGE